VNHSCEPNIAFDLTSADKQKWHARALRDIDPGETITFFYPSTEWDMKQSFECQCGTPVREHRPALARFLLWQVANGFRTNADMPQVHQWCALSQLCEAQWAWVHQSTHLGVNRSKSRNERRGSKMYSRGVSHICCNDSGGVYEKKGNCSVMKYSSYLQQLIASNRPSAGR